MDITITLKDNLSLQELTKVVNKLNAIINNKEDIIDTRKTSFEVVKASGKKNKNNKKGSLSILPFKKQAFKENPVKARLELVKALLITYHGEKEDKINYANNIGLEWDKIVAGFNTFRKSLANENKIKSEEVYLKSFPHRGEKLGELRLITYPEFKEKLNDINYKILNL